MVKIKRIISVMAVFCLSILASVLVACGERDLPDGLTQPKTYTVTFEYNYSGAPDGGVYKTEAVTGGETVAKPADPTRTDFAFNGWSSTTDGSSMWNFATPVAADMSLYAQWTENSAATDPVLSGIAITTAPNKTVFTVGDELDLTGLVVTATYDDSSSAPITVTASMISGYDKTATGTQTITVTYQGKTATFTVTVNPQTATDPELSSIAITTEPTKTEYEIDEELDLTGLVVTATYSDTTTAPVTVTTAMVTGFDSLSAGEKTLTVTYTEGEVTKTATFTVTVKAATPQRTLTGIAVTTGPAKLTYIEGEELDLTGLVVTATYSDTTTEPVTVTAAMLSGYSKTTLGAQTVTVTYNGETATFSVTVIEKSYTLVYDVGEHGNPIASETLKKSTLGANGKKLGKPTVTTDGYYFVCWKLNGSALADGTITAEILAAATGDEITVTAEYSNIYKVTFNSNGGSAVEAQNIAYGGKVTKPADPTMDGHVFLDWYKDANCTALWNFEKDAVTADLILHAQFGEAAGDGVYLVGSVFEGDLFTQGTEADKSRFKVKQTGDEYRITNIELHAGYDLKFVSYKNAGIENDPVINGYNTMLAGAKVRPSGIMTIVANNKGGFKIESLTAPTGATWTIAFGTNDKGEKYANFTLDGYIAFRDPSNPNGKIDETTEKADVIYLRGTFSGDYKTCKAWSSESDRITTYFDPTTQKYYFTKVYLKKYDEFKVYIGGVGDDGGWFGGIYAANAAFELTTKGDNIYLNTISDGYYNLIFENGTTKKLTVKPYQEIEVTMKSAVYVGYAPTENSFNVKVDGKAATYKVVSDNKAVSGSNTVKLLVGDAAVVYEYNATDEIATGIRIDTAPDKKEYYVGDTVDLTGMIVKLLHNSGKEITVPVSECNVSPLPTVANVTDKLDGQQTVVLKVSHLNFDADLSVKLKNKLTGISINVDGVKKSYFVGGRLDTSGLTVTAVFNNNSEVTQAVSGGYTVEADLTTAGEKKATVTFRGFTAVYGITVQEVVLDRITVEVDNKLLPEFKIGDALLQDGAIAGVTVTAHFTDGTSRTVNKESSYYADMTTAGEKTVTVSRTVNGITKTATFTINVAPLTVTFRNHDNTVFKTVTVNTYNTTIPEPAEKPVREHYDFEKWTLLDGGEFSFDTAITRSYTLVPTWAGKQYSVTFNSNGGNGTYQGQVVTYPGTATKPDTDPTHTDSSKKFVAWGVSENGVVKNFDFTSPVTADIELIAIWTDKAVLAVKFFDQDGSSLLYEQSIIDGELATYYEYKKVGYTLQGWYTSVDADAVTFDFGTPITSPIDLYAKWSLNTYTVTYDVNGGTLPSDIVGNKQTYTVESQEVVLATPTRDGYDFTGWYTDVNDPDTKVDGIDLTDPKNYSLIAGWTIKKFTVTFDPNDGSATTQKVVTYNSTVRKPDPDPVRAGYEFKYWYVTIEGQNKQWVFASGDSEDDPAADRVTENITLVARWNLIKYAVTYYLYDGAVTPANPTEYTVELGEVKLNDAAKTGYNFVGWFTTADGGVENKVTALTVDLFKGGKAINLHALYEIKTYSVTFDLNYTGAPTLDPVSVEHGKSVAEPTPAPEREEYEFKGWYTDAACTSSAWNFNSLITESNTKDGKLTLYAKWDPKPKQDGIYANDKFVKAFADNGSTESNVKLKIENVVLVKDAVITFIYNGKALDVDLRSGSGMSARINLVNGRIVVNALGENKTNGTFDFFYQSTNVSGEKGLWISDKEDYVEPELTDLDGIYVDETIFKKFEVNAEGLNEVKTEEFDLAEQTTFAIWYAGLKVNVSKKDNCPTGQFNDDGTVTLEPGKKYMFCLRYTDNALWISGVPEALNPDLNHVSVDSTNSGNDCWIVGKFSGVCDYDYNKGYKLTWNNGQWEITINLRAGDIVKFRRPFADNIYYAYYGISGINGGSDKQIKVDGDNISILETGRYSFYLKANGGNRASHIIDNYVVFSSL